MNWIALSCFTSLTCPPSITEGSSTWTGSLHRWAPAQPLAPLLRPRLSIFPPSSGLAGLLSTAPFVGQRSALPTSLCRSVLALNLSYAPDPGGLHTCPPPPDLDTIVRVEILMLLLWGFFISFLQVLCRLVKGRDKDKRLHHSFPCFQHSFN